MIGIGLFLTTCACTNAILSVKLQEMTLNESIVQNVSVTIRNLKYGVSMDVVATILYDVDRVLAYSRFNIPENPDDKYFKREILKTTVDIDKLFRGIATNFITKSVLKDLEGNLNFEPKFPLKKGVLKCLNLNVTDRYCPPIFSKGILSLRFVGKISGSKKMVYLSDFKFLAEIK